MNSTANKMSATLNQPRVNNYPNARRDGGQNRGNFKSGTAPNMERPSNIVMVSNRRQPAFYVFLVKKLIMNEKFDVVELHGAGDEAINSVARAAGILIRHKYCTISMIKTKTLEGRDSKLGKLIIQVSKGPDFDEVYKEFEDARERRVETYSKKEHHNGKVVDVKKPGKRTTPEKADSKSSASATEISPTQLTKQD